MKLVRHSALSIVVVAATALLAQPALAAKCSLKFSLKGWSAIYETANGTGVVTCDNGQSASVTIRTKGGGLTFGKTKIVNGKGDFSAVSDIREVFGNYAKAEVNAGMGQSSNAGVMTKGTVSLALAGTGQGITLGFDFGKFTISRAGKVK